MSTNQPTNPHRGSNFAEFLTQEGLMPTPRTDAIAHAGHNESVYIAKMTYLARQLERELASERAIVASLQALVTTDHESKEAFIRRCRQALAAWKEARRA